MAVLPHGQCYPQKCNVLKYFLLNLLHKNKINTASDFVQTYLKYPPHQLLCKKNMSNMHQSLKT